MRSFLLGLLVACVGACDDSSTNGRPDGGAGVGGGSAGSSGASGTGGAGGAAGSACFAATSVDRGCAVAEDCVALLHQANCCGGLAWLGIRATEEPRFDLLEMMCVDSYPACGCADPIIAADDGSQIAMGTTPPVTCAAGTCRTYAAACGQPCPAGTRCLPCMNGVGAVVPSCVDSCPTGP